MVTLFHDKFTPGKWTIKLRQKGMQPNAHTYVEFSTRKAAIEWYNNDLTQDIKDSFDETPELYHSEILKQTL